MQAAEAKVYFWRGLRPQRWRTPVALENRFADADSEGKWHGHIVQLAAKPTCRRSSHYRWIRSGNRGTLVDCSPASAHGHRQEWRGFQASGHAFRAKRNLILPTRTKRHGRTPRSACACNVLCGILSRVPGGSASAELRFHWRWRTNTLVGRLHGPAQWWAICPTGSRAQVSIRESLRSSKMRSARATSAASPGNLPDAIDLLRDVE